MAATWIFFFEYLPPVRWVHVPFDIEGYHYPLADYAFLALKDGRWPQWDPSIYSGMAFAANPQVALFYPGTWLMFLAAANRERLSYQALEDLTLAHVALAFTLCTLWLSRKKLAPLASVMGAAVFAFSGYMCIQLQHFGMIIAYAWMPFAFLGIDEAAERGSWKPMWKTAVASALAFLGGYPPTWLVFSLAVFVYALVRPGTWKLATWTMLALVFSLALCAVQLLPSWEATQYRNPELRYGIGIKDPMYFLSYLIPNFYDFGLNVPIGTNFGKEYLYLGAPGLLGFALALRPRNWPAILAPLASGIACLIVVTNPYALVWDSIKWSALLSDVVRSAYFLAGLSPAFALITAIGLDSFLSKKDVSVPAWLRPVALAAMAGWAIFDLVRWRNASFLPGWASSWDAVAMLVLFTLGLIVYRASEGRARMWMGVAVVLFAAIDYKSFGTSMRQNAVVGQGTVYSWKEFGAMNTEAYLTLRPPAPDHMSDYRIMMTDFSPAPSTSRHIRWTTPMGFDPFISREYLNLITRRGKWIDDRSLDLDPLDPDNMRVFGAKYVITGEAGPRYKGLLENPRYKMVGANDSYYKVFEYLDAKPIYQFPGTVNVTKRVPEHRVLQVDSSQGGTLTWSEQWFPGWKATIDGQTVPIGRWEEAFQSIEVPAGKHTVEFVYHEHLLPLGAAVSVVSLALLAWWIRANSKSTYNTANPAVSG